MPFAIKRLPLSVAEPKLVLVRVIVSFFSVFPFYWMILTSIKSYGQYNSEYVPKLYTLMPTFKNYLDAFTTVPAVVAEILMVLAYREQWFIWFLIDATYVVLWARTGNACMLLQFAFWCINCVYGFIRWNQALEIRNRHSEDIG